MKKFIILITLLTLTLNSCAVYKNKNRDITLIKYYEFSSPHEMKETPVFALTNSVVSTLPTSNFWASMSSLFEPIICLPPIILDLVFFPFKLLYAETSIAIHEEDEVLEE